MASPTDDPTISSARDRPSFPDDISLPERKSYQTPTLTRIDNLISLVGRGNGSRDGGTSTTKKP
jgi:hypothetical protein